MPAYSIPQPMSPLASRLRAVRRSLESGNVEAAMKDLQDICPNLLQVGESQLYSNAAYERIPLTLLETLDDAWPSRTLMLACRMCDTASS